MGVYPKKREKKRVRQHNLPFVFVNFFGSQFCESVDSSRCCRRRQLCLCFCTCSLACLFIEFVMSVAVVVISWSLLVV